ncbi:MAG: AsmA family protein [Burkholderiaceae bacterium]|nr:AsmA family protein [Burkholderiaceae bacterium]
MNSTAPPRRRWPWVLGAIALTLVAFIAIFDWNWFRGPLERRLSETSGRDVTIGYLDVELARHPRIVISDIAIGNADWAGDTPLAILRELLISVSVPSLFTNEIVLPFVRLSDGSVDLVRDKQNRANWQLRKSDQPSARTFDVQTLALNNASLSFRDAVQNINVNAAGETRSEGPYDSRVTFTGRWRGNPFEGTADTGNVLALRESSDPFPFRLAVRVGRTSLNAEGNVGTIRDFSQVDAKVSVSGPSLGALYPTLPLALPETPPYRITGRLIRDGETYTFENFSGVIGNTDLAGNARYERRAPRPMLSMTLKSRSLDLADLGPLVGLAPRTNAAAPAAATSAPTPAKAAPAKLPPGKVFPDRDFNLQKLNAMDADVVLTAATLKIPEQIPLENFSTHVKLTGGVMVLDPLTFGLAGGTLVSSITLDARSDPIAAKASIDLRRVRLGQLFPTVDTIKNTSTGSLGAQIKLAGKGNSIADMLATSDGTITAGMAGGRVSELGVWLVNLHGGKLIPLLFGGDRPTEIRCGAVSFAVDDGLATMGLFVFDTEESNINGAGTINLAEEKLDITLDPQPKKAGILSLRGPVHIQGTFRDVDFAVSGQTIGRGLGAIGLGLLNPLLALIPLIETGPGQNADCQAALQSVSGAVRQSGKKVSDAATASGESSTPAPIVDTRKRTGPPAPIIDTQKRAGPPAPIVDLPAKK